MSKYSEYKLKEVAEFEYGKMPKKGKLQLSGYPIFSGYRIVGYYPEYMYESEKLIIIARGVGGTGKVKLSPEKSYITNLSIIFNVNQEVANDNYLYYYLGNIDLKSKLDTGSAQSQITITQLEDLKIKLPTIEYQIKVQNLLMQIDEKINLNKQISNNLESVAKLMYEYWFLQFEFPDENGKPYKSSGGKMVWSEKLKKEIPAGWKTMELSEIIEKTGTGLNPRNNFVLGKGNNYYVTIKNMVDGRIVFDNCDKIDDEALKIINKRSDLKPGDILFTSIEPVGTTYFVHETPTNWNINESVFTIRPDYKKTNAEFLYMLLSSLEMKAFTSNASAGSIHKGIRHNVLKTFRFAYSDSSLIFGQFSELLKPLLKKIDTLNNENRKITQLRDWLLPMLMNGQVRIKD